MDERVVLSNLLAAPVFDAVAASATQVNLTWHRVAGATAYSIDEWINGSWVLIASMGAHSNSCVVNGLAPNTAYNLRMGASRDAHTVWAQQKTVTTFAAPPSAPPFLIFQVSTTQIAVCWAPVSGATLYIVGVDVNNAWRFAVVSGSSNSYVVSGLAPNAAYLFDVAAYNTQGMTFGRPEVGVTNPQWWVYDHPDSLGSYAPVYGSLFGPGGPSFLDVQQGECGDCWFLASLAEVAARDPADIANMFTYICTTVENTGQGLAVVNVYNVRFFDSSGKAEYVTVDTELPSSANGGYCYYDHPANGILWPALAEKAYVEANKLGYVTTQFVGYDTYLALWGGDPAWALQAITGKPANDYSINPADVANAWNAGALVVICTGNSPASSYIVPDHCYAVVAHDSSCGEFGVYNPWGVNLSTGWALGTYNGHQVYGLFWADGNFLSQNYDMESFGVGMGVIQISTNDNDVLLGVYPIDSVGQHLGNKQIKRAEHAQPDDIQKQLLRDVAMERVEQSLHLSRGASMSR
jgi:hypothetical protein